jgi:hypothetical protein
MIDRGGSIGSSIIKTVPRAMAEEYNRELSVKVFAGQANLIWLGFRQGGAAGYGLRRVLVDQDGRPKSELDRGEHKSIATDRVILVPLALRRASVSSVVPSVFLIYPSPRTLKRIHQIGLPGRWKIVNESFPAIWLNSMRSMSRIHSVARFADCAGCA